MFFNLLKQELNSNIGNCNTNLFVVFDQISLKLLYNGWTIMLTYYYTCTCRCVYILCNTKNIFLQTKSQRFRTKRGGICSISKDAKRVRSLVPNQLRSQVTKSCIVTLPRIAKIAFGVYKPCSF